MRTFVINLDKNTERLAKFDALMRQLELPYERVRAVYGKELPVDEKKKAANRFAWWCVKGYEMRDGELGAALSHQLVYRKLLEDDIPFACVFEDDVSMDDRISEQLKRIGTWICPDKPQVVLLSNYTKVSSDKWEVVESSGDSSAEAYVITRAAAEMLLKRNYPVLAPSDLWAYWVKRGLLELYHAYPTVVHPAWRDDANYHSDVTPDNTVVADVRRLSAIGKLLWKCKRAIGLILAKILY